MAGMRCRIILGLCLMAGVFSTFGGDSGGGDISWALRSGANGNVFTDSVHPEFFFRDAPSGGMLQYEVKNWLSESVCSGSWNPADNNGHLLLNSLPYGCYKLFVRSDKVAFHGYVSFAIVPSLSKRKTNPDSPYCVNTAISWLACPDKNNPRQPADSYKSVADLAQMAGLSMVREMTSWGEFAPQPSKYTWENRYMNNARLFAARGINNVMMFQEAAAWAKNREIPGSRKLPDDLFGLYDFTKNAGKAFDGLTTAWEFWNEETTLSYSTEPAWDFASAQKAAYLGFKAGNPKVKVLCGSFPSAPTIEKQNQRNAFFSPILKYEALLFDNGFGEYMDVLNYHLYELFSEYPLIIKARNSLLKKHGLEGTPSWITELGSNYEGYAVEPTFLGDWRGDLNDHQDRIIAEFVPKSQIIAQSLGIEKSFHFAFPAYNEGKKLWGLLHWNYTVRPGYVALANLTYRLANAQYEGTYNLGPQLSAFLYRQPDATQTLVFWSRSELDNRLRNGSLGVNANDLREHNISLNVNVPSGSSLLLADTVGKETTLKVNGSMLKLTATRFPSYLSGKLGLSPSISAPEKHPREPSAKDLSIVFKLLLGDAFTPYKTFAGMIGDSGTLGLEVYNFSDETKSGKVEFVGSGKMEGLPESVTIAPHSKVKLDLCFRSAKQMENLISFTGLFNGKKISPIYAPVWRPTDSSARSFEFDNVARWKVASTGKADIGYDAQEKALRIQATATSNDCYVAAEYALKLPKESLRNAVGFSFEVKVSKDAPPDCYSSQFVAVQDKDKTETIIYPIPSTQWKTAFVYFPSDSSPYFNPDRVKTFKISLRLPNEGGVCWLRNIKAIYRQNL